MYDGTTEQLGALMRSNLFELDRRTSEKVVLTYIGNPREVGPVYEALRDSELRARDEADARTLAEERKRGVGADYVRRHEVNKLVELVGVSSDSLPCVAFYPYPPCVRPALLKISPGWIFSASARRKFIRALISFFETTDLDALARGCRTSDELAREFEKRIVGHMKNHLGQAIPEPISREAHVFQREGDTWLVAYDGLRANIRDSVGMTYISHLLEHPGKVFHAAALSASVSGEEGTVILGSAGDVVDHLALADYHKAHADLGAQIETAEKNHDSARIERLQEEREKLAAEIGRATGLGGRSRKAADDSERARKRVTNAIRRALNAIQPVNGPLWRHLRSSLKTGTLLSYHPNSPTSWTT